MVHRGLCGVEETYLLVEPISESYVLHFFFFKYILYILYVITCILSMIKNCCTLKRFDNIPLPPPKKKDFGIIKENFYFLW